MHSQQAVAGYSFNVKTNGNTHEIAYNKSKFGIKMYFAMLWPSIILGAFLAYWSRPRHMNMAETFSMGVFYWIVYALLIPLAAIILLNLLRRPGFFTLGETAISIDGTSYAYKDINGIYIKTPSGERASTLVSQSTRWGIIGGDRVQQVGFAAATTVANAASGIASAGAQLSNASRRAMVNNYQSKNFKICAIFGEKELVIATGLTEKSAHVLINKIDELI
jgi:hypothetical protein